MRIQNCFLSLKAYNKDLNNAYNINGSVFNGKVNLTICNNKGDQVGIAKGDLGEFGAFYITAYLNTVPYKRVSFYGELIDDLISNAGVSFDEEQQPTHIEGVIRKDTFVSFTLLNKEGIYSLIIQGEVKFEDEY